MSANEAEPNQSAVTLQIGPVSASDILLLHEALGSDLAGAMSSEPAEGDGLLGDPGTVFVVLALSPAVIAAVTAFLLKPRRSERVTYRLNATFADGTTISEECDINRRESLPPPAEVLDSLTKLTRLQRPPMPAVGGHGESGDSGDSDGGE